MKGIFYKLINMRKNQVVSNFSCGKAPDDLWSSRIEACHVQHARICGICDGEVVGGHSTHNEFSINARGLAVLLQGLGGMYLACGR